MGRRTEGEALTVRSGHVLSETAGAENSRVDRLIPSRLCSRVRGASIDGEDRIFRPWGFLTANAVRTICPALGSPTSGDRRKSSRRSSRLIRAARHVQQAGHKPADRRQHRG